MILSLKASTPSKEHITQVEAVRRGSEYPVAMIRRSCSGCVSPSSVLSEEFSKPAPVLDNAVELQREASPVRNQCTSTTAEEKILEDPVTVDTSGEDCGRERLKRHRVDVAGRVWIPDIWGQEDCLKDWIDCSTFDRSLFPTGITSARKALVEEGR